MPRRAIVLFLCLLGASTAAHADARLDEVLAVDRAFALRSSETGAQAAFLEFLAPDGVLFRPTAVNGADWLRTHEEASGRLDWVPATGRMSCDGQLAITLGPWTYRQDALVATGSYLTVWRREADGNWRVVIDHGVDGPSAPGPPPVMPVLAPSADASCPAGRNGPDLARADEKLNATIHGKGIDLALRKALLPEALVLRDGHGVAAAGADWPHAEAAWSGSTAVTRGSYAAAGGDLAYTYGELTGQAARKGPIETRAVFLRVWVRNGREWRLLADMTTTVAGK